jgi:hypothetical protein
MKPRTVLTIAERRKLIEKHEEDVLAKTKARLKREFTEKHRENWHQ